MGQESGQKGEEQGESVRLTDRWIETDRQTEIERKTRGKQVERVRALPTAAAEAVTLHSTMVKCVRRSVEVPKTINVRECVQFVRHECARARAHVRLRACTRAAPQPTIRTGGRGAAGG